MRTFCEMNCFSNHGDDPVLSPWLIWNEVNLNAASSVQSSEVLPSIHQHAIDDFQGTRVENFVLVRGPRTMTPKSETLVGRVDRRGCSSNKP